LEALEDESTYVIGIANKALANLKESEEELEAS